jgi:hypothetical protein
VLQRRVELVVGLRLGQPFEQPTGEARDHRRVLGQERARFVAAVATGQGQHLQHTRVGGQVGVQAGVRGDGELQHDERVGREGVEVRGDGVVQQRLRLVLVRAGDADLWLDDRHEARRHDPAAVLELLVHDRRDACLVGVADHRPHLGAEDPMLLGPPEQVIESVDGLHEPHAVTLSGEALVDLEEWHHVLFLPQVLRRGHALDGAVHGLLEQDRGEDARPVERRAGQHAGAHGVDEVEHLVFGVVAVPADTVGRQRAGRAAAALVQGSEEAVAGLDLLKLRHVHAPRFWHPAPLPEHPPPLHAFARPRVLSTVGACARMWPGRLPRRKRLQARS